jgi:hypothetical protein
MAGVSHLIPVSVACSPPRVRRMDSQSVGSGNARDSGTVSYVYHILYSTGRLWCQGQRSTPPTWYTRLDLVLVAHIN